MLNSPPQVNGGVIRGGLVDGVSVVVSGVVGGGVGTLTDWNVHLNPLWLELWVGPAWKMAKARLEDIVIDPGSVH